MEISKISTTVRHVQGWYEKSVVRTVRKIQGWYEKSMVRNVHGTKSPRMVRNVYGTNSPAILSMYGANDASCTSAGTTSCPTMKFCVVPACSTSRTSSVSEDWVSLATSPHFEVMMYVQCESKKSPPCGFLKIFPQLVGNF